MYIAGLRLPLSSPQWLEVLVVLGAADYIRYTVAKVKTLAVASESKAGRIRQDRVPSTFLGRIVTPIHGLATVAPPMIYVGALVLNRFQPPEWMARYALPFEMRDSTWRSALRVVACVADLALKSFTDSIFGHLGDQWHTIGACMRREKPRIVKTGPYAWVRHPLYSSVLIQQTLWSIMFWSYIPLVALGITASTLAVKMPIEENLIQKDDAVRDEYQKYMKEVPARIIPYIW